jgi:hypothetical protein
MAHQALGEFHPALADHRKTQEPQRKATTQKRFLPLLQ